MSGWKDENLRRMPLGAILTEHDKIQAGIVDWARLMQHIEPRLAGLYAVPNGGWRDKRTAAQLKACGVKAGVLDLHLPVPLFSHGYVDKIELYNGSEIDIPKLETRIVYTSFYLEVKLPSERNHKDGGLSPDQVAFRDFVVKHGSFVEIAYTTMEGIDMIRNYLGMR